MTMRQHVVFHVDQRQRLIGDRLGGGGDGGHARGLRTAPSSRAMQFSDRSRKFIGPSPTNASSDGMSGKVRCRHDSLHARQRLGLARVDRYDPRMRVRRAQDLAPQHARGPRIGREHRAAGDLVDAVGTDGTGADDFQTGIDVVHPTVSPRRFGGGVHHRANDLVVAGATAQVAGQPVARLGFGRVRIVVEQRLRWRRSGRACRTRTASAACSRNFCCTGCSLSPLAMPSIVVIDVPSASTPSTRQEHTRRPSMITVQAPQSPDAQPSLLPVRPTTSRSTSSRVCCGSHRNSADSPLMVAET